MLHLLSKYFEETNIFEWFIFYFWSIFTLFKNNLNITNKKLLIVNDIGTLIGHMKMNKNKNVPKFIECWKIIWTRFKSCINNGSNSCSSLFDVRQNCVRRMLKKLKFSNTFFSHLPTVEIYYIDFGNLSSISCQELNSFIIFRLDSFSF